MMLGSGWSTFTRRWRHLKQPLLARDISSEVLNYAIFDRTYDAVGIKRRRLCSRWSLEAFTAESGLWMRILKVGWFARVSDLSALRSCATTHAEPCLSKSSAHPYVARRHCHHIATSHSRILRFEETSQYCFLYIISWLTAESPLITKTMLHRNIKTWIYNRRILYPVSILYLTYIHPLPTMQFWYPMLHKLQ